MVFDFYLILYQTCDLPTNSKGFFYRRTDTHTLTHAHIYSHEVNVFPCKRILLCDSLTYLYLCVSRNFFLYSLFLTQFYANQIFISGLLPLTKKKNFGAEWFFCEYTLDIILIALSMSVCINIVSHRKLYDHKSMIEKRKTEENRNSTNKINAR